jgi:ABC-type antimicrobial peptide transport system permease subunit
VRAIDAGVPLYNVRTLAQHIDLSLSRDRMATNLARGLGALAFLLAAVGLYGTLAYAVAQRTRELGIRIAIGARPVEMRRAVLFSGLRIVAFGLLIGVPAALGLTRLLESALFGIPPDDPVTFAAVSLILLGMGAAASYAPARRATRVDPMIALRSE